jgi:hypothetical protein
MIRKLIVIILGFYGLAILTSLLQSCDCYDTFINHIDLYGINNKSWDTEPDDLSKSFGFNIRADYTRISANIIRNINIINSCYAFSKCAHYVNDLVDSTYSLSFDKLILIKNDSIKPENNFLQNSIIKPNIKISKGVDSHAIYSTILLTDSIYSKMITDTGVYIATFRCKTTDGKELQSQRKVRFRK